MILQTAFDATIGSPERSAVPRPAAWLHAGLIALTLLVCLVLPRAGQGVLLVPLAAGAPGLLLHRSDLGEPAVLGRGPLPGSWLIRPSGPLPLWGLLHDGILPLAVPLALCGQDTAPPVPTPADHIEPRGTHG